MIGWAASALKIKESDFKRIKALKSRLEGSRPNTSKGQNPRPWVVDGRVAGRSREPELL